MAVRSIDYLKAKFETGDKPVQQDFWDWLDSFRHAQTLITYDDLNAALQTMLNSIPEATPLSVVLPQGATQWAAPACLIDTIAIDDASNPAISIGSTLGGNEYADALQLENGEFILQQVIRLKNAATIYFTGVTANTIITIYKR